MTPRDKALRAQDIQAGLQGWENVPFTVVGELDPTILAGMACRLATHIRGADVFTEENIPRLRGVAQTLGIPSTSLKSVLQEMEECELVQVQTSGGALKLVRESVPTYGDLYDTVGQVYSAKTHSETEDALVETYGTLVEAPKVSDGSLPIETLAENQRIALFDIAEKTKLIRTVHTGNGQKVLFAPQYWDENAGQMLEVVSQFEDERLRSVIKNVQNRQGLAIPGIRDCSEDALLLRVLASAGMLPAPTVNGVSGEVAFAFTPFKNSDLDPAIASKLFEKTRAILACVRYGESYARVTSIHSPLQVLRVLKDRGRIGPHSEAYHQYKTLLENGVCTISKDTYFTSRYWVHLIKNEENERALDAAIDILETGVPLSVTDVNPELADYAINGDYSEPITVRARNKYSPSRDAEAAINADMMEILLLK